MNGRALIEALRDKDALPSDFGCGMEMANLLADAVEIADEACWELIVSECLRVAPWWNTQFATSDGIDAALSYLDRRGLIERKEGEPHMVRFIETEG